MVPRDQCKILKLIIFSAELYDPAKNLSMYFIYVIYIVTLIAVERTYLLYLDIIVRLTVLLDKCPFLGH